MQGSIRVGELFGFLVYVNHDLPLGEVQFRDPMTDKVLARFSCGSPLAATLGEAAKLKMDPEG